MLFHRTKSLTPADAAAALGRRELQVIDVREAAEVAHQRVEGAMHIPLRELPRRLGEIDRTQRVAFLCRSGSRSAVATRVAANVGVDAVNVRGGVLAWSRAGLPLTCDSSRA
jgi:rhodanese-related sulfurtransferase